MEVPSANLKDRLIPKEVLNYIPQESASFYKMVPFAWSNGILQVAMLNPQDINAQEALKFISQNNNNLKYQIFSARQEELVKAIKQYGDLAGEVNQALTNLEAELKRAEAQKTEEKVAIKSITEEAPITRVVAVILRHAVDGNASDIHIEPEEEKLRVRFRVDGLLHSSLILPKKIHASIVSRIKILSKLKIDESRKPQDGRFRAVIRDKKIDFRVSTMPTNHGEKVVMRLLDVTVGLLELSELGMTDRNLEVTQKALQKTTGLILVTGPTGSGKSTTLYSLLKILNEEAVNIITLEDPIEYWIEGVNQSQVMPEIGYTFASGLRSILRQDPDIIMVGEIRDAETAELAIHAALTGHIVLSTLHTNDAKGAIPRLIDMGLEPYLLISALNLVIAQRLARKVEKLGSWQEASPEIQAVFQTAFESASEEAKERYQEKFKPPLRLPEVKSEKGRIGVFEVLEM